MPERDQLIADLRALLRSMQPRLPDTWPDGLSFRAGLGLDSLDLVELVARIEQRYGVLIPDAALATFISVDAVADYLSVDRAE